MKYVRLSLEIVGAICVSLVLLGVIATSTPAAEITGLLGNAPAQLWQTDCAGRDTEMVLLPSRDLQLGCMELRDYFAGQALSTTATWFPRMWPADRRMAAESAYQLADAMMKARENGQ